MTNPVETALAAITKDMDPSTGMYPVGWACSRCGKTLNADGCHPAELYAGTFTGLCYGCERSGSYVVPGSELPDGARLVSHPPSCPSWRRDRTEHWAYPDCPDCGGQGARVRYSSMSHGNYTEYCRACAARVTAPRRANEVALLRAVADALEAEHLRTVVPQGEQTPVQASVRDAVLRVMAPAVRARSDLPAPWRPSQSVLMAGESRLTKAQLGAKRAETLRRHAVAALRAEADALAAPRSSS